MRGNRLVVGEYFPFIHFVSVVVVPFTYWVACIELGVYNSNENQFTLSFGQVSALPVLAFVPNNSIRPNTRSSQFLWRSLHSSKCASSRLAYTTGFMTLRGSGGSTATVANHDFPARMMVA